MRFVRVIIPKAEHIFHAATARPGKSRAARSRAQLRSKKKSTSLFANFNVERKLQTSIFQDKGAHIKPIIHMQVMGTRFKARKPRQGPEKACFALIFVVSFLPISTIAFSPSGTQSAGSIFTKSLNCLRNCMRVVHDERTNGPAFLARGITPQHRLRVSMNERNRVFHPIHERHLNQRKPTTFYSEDFREKPCFELAQVRKTDFAKEIPQEGAHHDGFEQTP